MANVTLMRSVSVTTRGSEESITSERELGLSYTAYAPSPERLALYSEYARMQLERAPRGTFPEKLVERYMLVARTEAIVEVLEDGSFYASVHAISGAWGSGESAKSAVEDLISSLKGWLELKIADHDGDIPILHGIDLNKIE